MKKYLSIIACATLALASCDSYLDKLPDDRAEVNTEEKVKSFLVSAYPAIANNVIMETSTDNVSDYGRQYGTSDLKDEAYRFKDITDTGNDSPRHLWNGYYEAIATANQAIASIIEMGNPKSLAPQMAEAKLCRAYSMFMLSNTFCMAYDPQKADEYAGLPYPKEPGLLINERGTLAELYADIDKDIEDALPDVTDNYSVPKYHFNTKAAYAFAARFNLYYHQYDKCVKYATTALGSVPSSVMRDYTKYLQFGADDIGNKYVNASESANFLLIPAYSLTWRALMVGAWPRYQHNYNMTNYETYWAEAPWGVGSSANTLYYATMLYGSNPAVQFPKINEFFEYTDKVGGSGYVHTVHTAFTGDETLLCRAEAYALLKQYDNCVADLNIWVNSHCAEEKDGTKRPVLTVDNINKFIESIDYAPVTPESNRDRTIRKVLNPQGFTVEPGTQENIIEMLLHMRRLETMFEGLRFMDIKRYGIEFAHVVSGEDPIVFSAGDLRGALQIPGDVVNAGLAANPRQVAASK